MSLSSSFVALEDVSVSVGLFAASIIAFACCMLYATRRNTPQRRRRPFSCSAPCGCCARDDDDSYYNYYLDESSLSSSLLHRDLLLTEVDAGHSWPNQRREEGVRDQIALSGSSTTSSSSSSSSRYQSPVAPGFFPDLLSEGKDVCVQQV